MSLHNCHLSKSIPADLEEFYHRAQGLNLNDQEVSLADNSFDEAKQVPFINYLKEYNSVSDVSKKQTFDIFAIDFEENFNPFYEFNDEDGLATDDIALNLQEQDQDNNNHDNQNFVDPDEVIQRFDELLDEFNQQNHMLFVHF